MRSRRDLGDTPPAPHNPSGKEAAISELARVSLFERLEKQELETLDTLTHRKRYPASTAVFFQDDPSDSLYIVLSGSAKVFQTSESGQDRICCLSRAVAIRGAAVLGLGRQRMG